MPNEPQNLEPNYVPAVPLNENKDFKVGDPAFGNYIRTDSSGNLVINDTILSNNATYGDGSDGDVVISENTTLTADMYYNNLTIDTAVTLSPNGFRIFVKNPITFYGTGKIASNGGAGTQGTDSIGNPAAGGTGGTAAQTAGSLPATVAGQNGGTGAESGGSSSTGDNGTSVAKSVGVVGIAGGDGGAGGGGGGNPGGGSAGSRTGTVFNSIHNFTSAYLFSDVLPSLAMFTGSSGSGGGGGGGNDNANGGDGGGGGGSGAPGGIIWVAARKIVTVDGNNFIEAKGGNGGRGGNANSIGGGGGGGGAAGSGGVVILIYSSKTGTGTISVAGGTSGAGGTKTGGGVNGVTPANGNTGTTISLQV